MCGAIIVPAILGRHILHCMEVNNAVPMQSLIMGVVEDKVNLNIVLSSIT